MNAQVANKHNDGLPVFTKWLVALFVFIAFVGLLLSRHWLLDDAFIHLRIGKNLAELGHYEFNPGAPGFGTSSPLYTALLAALWHAAPLPYLPKVVNVVAYAALLALILGTLVRRTHAFERLLILALFAALCSPMSLRWLTDGMETGLVAIVSILMAKVACAPGGEQPNPRFLAFALGLGVVATTLRVEFAYIGALLFAGVALESLAQRKIARGPAWVVISIAAGMSAGLFVIFAIFGHILPDTAVAKSNPANLSLATAVSSIGDIARAHAGASFFGVVTLALWGISSYHALSSGRRVVFAATLNAGLPVMFMLIVGRQQAVHGMRYFVFLEIFLITANILVSRPEHVAMSVESLRGPKGRMALSLVVLFLALAWIFYDGVRFRAMSQSAGQALAAMESRDVQQLKGSRGVAWDVGMIGFFSDAEILDVHGLVNGRQVATMPEATRVRIIEEDPKVSFVFGNREQLQEVGALLKRCTWSPRQVVNFESFSGNKNTHYLLLKEPGCV